MYENQEYVIGRIYQRNFKNNREYNVSVFYISFLKFRKSKRLYFKNGFFRVHPFII